MAISVPLTLYSESLFKRRMLRHALQLSVAFALASVVKLFSSQASPATGNQDLTVLLASRVCPRDVRPGREQVFVQFRTFTAEIIAGSGSKPNVKMSGSGLPFFSCRDRLPSCAVCVLRCWKF